MKRLFALTLFGLIAINCSSGNHGNAPSSRGSTMTYGVGTQAELDAANQRINQYKEALLKQGFRQVSVSRSDVTDPFPNSTEKVVLEGQHGTLKDLRVTLWTSKQLKTDEPELGGGIHATLRDEQADREFEELYKKVVFVVTGHNQW